jgi:hypothetical protein
MCCHLSVVNLTGTPFCEHIINIISLIRLQTLLRSNAAQRIRCLMGFAVLYPSYAGSSVSDRLVEPRADHLDVVQVVNVSRVLDRLLVIELVDRVAAAPSGLPATHKGREPLLHTCQVLG